MYISNRNFTSFTLKVKPELYKLLHIDNLLKVNRIIHDLKHEAGFSFFSGIRLSQSFPSRLTL